MFSELTRETVFARINDMGQMPSATRVALKPTANETCITFHVNGEIVSVFHRGVGGGIALTYTLRSVVVQRVDGAWRVIANLRTPCPPTARPPRVDIAGPVPPVAYSHRTATETTDATRARRATARAARAQLVNARRDQRRANVADTNDYPEGFQSHARP